MILLWRILLPISNITYGVIRLDGSRDGSHFEVEII